jgi:hypothetical protein
MWACIVHPQHSNCNSDQSSGDALDGSDGDHARATTINKCTTRFGHWLNNAINTLF